MEEIDAEQLVGLLLGEEGWAGYMKIAGNAEGDLSKEAFHELVFSKFEQELFGDFANKDLVITPEYMQDKIAQSHARARAMSVVFGGAISLFSIMGTVELQAAAMRRDEV